jgi:hypothetical protein
LLLLLFFEINGSFEKSLQERKKRRHSLLEVYIYIYIYIHRFKVFVAGSIHRSKTNEPAVQPVLNGWTIEPTASPVRSPVRFEKLWIEVPKEIKMTRVVDRR